MDISPDGTLLAMSIADNTLETAKTIRGRVVLVSFKGEKPEIKELAGDTPGLAHGRLRFSPSGKFLVGQFGNLPGERSGLSVWTVASTSLRTLLPKWDGKGGEYPKYGEPLVAYKTFDFTEGDRVAIYCNPLFYKQGKGYSTWYSHAGLEIRDLGTGEVRFTGTMNPFVDETGNLSIEPARENVTTLRSLGDGLFMLLGTRTEKANRTIYRTKGELLTYDAATGKLQIDPFLKSINFIHHWQHAEATGTTAFFHSSAERGPWTLSVVDRDGKLLASRVGAGYSVLGWSAPRFSSDGKLLQVNVHDSVPDEKSNKLAKPGTTVSTVTRSGVAILEAATLKEIAFYAGQQSVAVVPTGKLAVTSARNYKSAKPAVTLTVHGIRH
ncbi:MAG: hypothetical protein HONBIEJF_01396 [Fimbriimonadaceae bacterium]|nr:hypothetical protein [Fimbriimonadaceae bacterium]